ncbi:protein phosphatase 1 regulatory subunit 3C-B-like [Ctenocephalides felis]|uniref:protein phosphatase 1 regulatory subunit 3C-B-like n=1 Tax=Ctenocephalides felis TaxID=7515 RepID=UPI000E6E33E5|nr:protein phosphatase 1 regulatory subunit 3C-B-like [Ctenocephalides felis]
MAVIRMRPGRRLFRDSWHPRFEQPARDYVAFRRKLEESNVALENIVVRKKDDGSCSGGNENKAVGTVKVRNLDYHKDVIIRYTTDGWKTYKDETCSHVPTSASAKTGPSSAFHLHDTFRFELLLPTVAKSGNPSAEKSGNTNISTQLARMTLGDDRNLKNSDTGVVFCDRVEFCLRFRCAGGEYWDNNSGRNYVIQRRQQNVITMSKLADSPKASDKVREATYASMNGGSWSEFASWQHLDNNCPYW